MRRCRGISASMKKTVKIRSHLPALQRHSFGLFIFCIAICFFAAGIGSLFTTQSISNWYAYLNKPFFNPPNWLFGPVWTVLYALMGYSLYLVLGSKVQKHTRQAVILFALQLILNMLWSIVFFGLHFPGMALLVIVCLWIAILHTMRSFVCISKAASYLLLPYLLWVSFATILNGAIVLLN